MPPCLLQLSQPRRRLRQTSLRPQLPPRLFFLRSPTVRLSQRLRLQPPPVLIPPLRLLLITSPQLCKALLQQRPPSSKLQPPPSGVVDPRKQKSEVTKLRYLAVCSSQRRIPPPVLRLAACDESCTFWAFNTNVNQCYIANIGSGSNLLCFNGAFTLTWTSGSQFTVCPRRCTFVFWRERSYLELFCWVLVILVFIV